MVRSRSRRSDLPDRSSTCYTLSLSRTDTPVVVVLIVSAGHFGSGGQSKFGPTPNTLLDGVQAYGGLELWIRRWECSCRSVVWEGQPLPAVSLRTGSIVGSAGATSSSWGWHASRVTMTVRLKRGIQGRVCFRLWPRLLAGAPWRAIAFHQQHLHTGETTLTVTIHNSATMAGATLCRSIFGSELVESLAPFASGQFHESLGAGERLGICISHNQC